MLKRLIGATKTLKGGTNQKSQSKKGQIPKVRLKIKRQVTDQSELKSTKKKTIIQNHESKQFEEILKI